MWRGHLSLSSTPSAESAPPFSTPPSAHVTSLHRCLREHGPPSLSPKKDRGSTPFKAAIFSLDCPLQPSGKLFVLFCFNVHLRILRESGRARGHEQGRGRERERERENLNAVALARGSGHSAARAKRGGQLLPLLSVLDASARGFLALRCFPCRTILGTLCYHHPSPPLSPSGWVSIVMVCPGLDLLLPQGAAP